MEEFEVAIIGNGVIGTLAALRLAESGLRVALAGKPGRPGSASTAAGAMLNVYGEVDGPLDDYARRKIAIGKRAIALWRAMLPTDVFVADRTRVYRKAGCSPLETRCFDAIASAASIRPKAWGTMDVVVLENEPAVSSPALFEWMDNRLRSLGVAICETVPRARRTVHCAGAFTRVPGTLPVYFGVGNALVISDVEINIPPRTVVRSPNRGNTCGVHLVPRGSSYYLGAGSYIDTGPSEGYRIETLRYLVKCIEDDFGVETWQASIQPVKGYRPISLDGKPMLGPLSENPNVYVATGTKRDGLTYAPVIADDILAWATGRPRDIFSGWEPDRQPISFGTKAHAIEVYIENRIAALNEHGRSMTPDRARKDAEAAYARAAGHLKLPNDFGLHPELLHVI
ncbi:MAG: FAD-binding oxidoreductase [Rhodospirillaceae bacterium]|nr:FAD-binding oxidoreductase [Rhodospirillaceae bacterium]